MELKKIKRQIARITISNRITQMENKSWRDYLVVILPEEVEKFKISKYKKSGYRHAVIPIICGIGLDGTPIYDSCGMCEEDVLSKPTMQDYFEIIAAFREHQKKLI